MLEFFPSERSDFLEKNILFYHDAEATGKYVKLGAFDAAEEFITAVEDNPVLESWGNKVVSITSKKRNPNPEKEASS